MPSPRRHRTRARRSRGAALVDEMVDRYVEWREACAWVEHAYRRWDQARGRGSGPAHARYLAALDREEGAARAYAELVRRVAASAGTPAFR
jgi:hypothetical protein